MKTYFDEPTQCLWYDGEHYCGGIAFRDEVICADCGGVIKIQTIVEDAEGDGKVPVYVAEIWEDFAEAIADEADIGVNMLVHPEEYTPITEMKQSYICKADEEDEDEDDAP